MTGHIEYIGPPGAGKSSIYKHIIQSERIYAGHNQGGFFYYFCPDSFRRLERVIPFAFSRYIGYKLFELGISKPFENFIIRNPKYLFCMYNSINNITQSNFRQKRRQLYTLLKRTATMYEIGSSTLPSKKTLCIDEGFCHRAFSISHKRESFTLPEDVFFESIPKPQALIHVDASAKKLQQRRYTRDGVLTPIDKIHIERKTCKKICDKISQYGTHVVNINNEERTIRSSANEVLSRLPVGTQDK